MSNLTSASGEASVSSTNRNDNNGANIYHPPPPQYFPPLNPPQPHSQPLKKKRNQPGHPDPDAEVIALSPRTLLATNRFVCEICNKGFQRDQNLQLHRRGHNLPWKLKQRSNKEVVRKKVYVCPETSCVHHDPSRALGDLTGIKKHFCRKHGEKKWKCDKCSKKYAVQSDWKAHSKTCGTREYRCDCGTLFSRRDSFITHRAFCDALAEESARSITGNNINIPIQSSAISHHMNLQQVGSQFSNSGNQELQFSVKKEQQNFSLRPEIPPWLACPPTMGPHPGPPTPIDLTAPSSSSSLFQDFQQNQDFSQNHDHQNANPNPSSSTTTTSLGPTTTLPPPAYHHHHPPPAAASPHISATALLQKAAQMGAKSSSQCPSPAGMFIRPHQAHVSAGDSAHSATTGNFGLNLSSSRDEFINGLASYGNKAAAAAAAAPVTGGAAVSAASGGTSNDPHHHPSLLHDMMINNPGFDQGSSFEDMGFAGILINHHPSKKDHQDLSFHATFDQFSTTNHTRNEGGINGEGMTRDFLGLRPLSQSDILSIAGLSNCMNNNACNHEDQNQTQKSWQG
ncbi:protein indeterminate-domain 7 [Sesamum alatum]|uniref:Protein indeterminate-domain 7 n=1 Tax=Sesamum alatum TaxID=300844 RepID=A0AAE1YBR8_9LAMI|nr:protein indeterminate-domain 7 [Sesamum alatum]